MRASARNLLLAACLNIGTATLAGATEGVYLPPAPNGPGGEDTIESSSGTRCRQSINSNGPYLDLGVAGSAAGGGKSNSSYVATDQRDRTGLAYARLVMPIGSVPKRIDCSRIFELEITRLQREIEMLRMNAE